MSYSIYKITCSITDEVYVGKTEQDVSDRFKEHMYSALHRNSNADIHKSIRLHGVKAFTYAVLESDISDPIDASNAEIKWVMELDSYASGYNMTLGGDGKLGYVPTDASKAKAAFSRSHNTIDGVLVTKLAYEKRNVTLLDRDNDALIKIGEKSSITQIKNGKNKDDGNPNSRSVSLFDADGNKLFTGKTCKEFKQLCEQRGFPVRVLEKSYQQDGNPIYQTATTPTRLLTHKHRGYYAKYD